MNPNLPYGDYPLTPFVGERGRPENIKIYKCHEDGWYLALHGNGKYYPLENRLDPDSDVVGRVIDGSNFTT